MTHRVAVSELSSIAAIRSESRTMTAGRTGVIPGKTGGRRS
jgi:hypothetical protein